MVFFAQYLFFCLLEYHAVSLAKSNCIGNNCESSLCRIAVFYRMLLVRYDAHQVLEPRCGLGCVCILEMWFCHVFFTESEHPELFLIRLASCFSYESMWFARVLPVQPFVPSDKRWTGAKLNLTEYVGVCFSVGLLLQNPCEWQLRWSAFGTTMCLCKSRFVSQSLTLVCITV